MDFCTNCGTELNGAEFCPECGTKVEQQNAAPVDAPVYDAPAPEVSGPVNSQNLVKIIAAAVAVIVVVVGAFLIFGGGNSPEAVAKDAVKAVLKGDAKKVVSLMPKKVVNYEVEEEYDGDKKEMIDELQDMFDKMKEAMEDEDIKVSKIKYEVKDVDKMKKDTIEMYEEQYEDADIEIKEGKIVEIEMSMPDPDDKDEERETTINMYVVKIGGKWSLINSSLF